ESPSRATAWPMTCATRATRASSPPSSGRSRSRGSRRPCRSSSRSAKRPRREGNFFRLGTYLDFEADVSTLMQDLRYAVRTLAKTPGFTAVALATLALGIGSNSAICSVVNAVLLAPLAHPEPERLVRVYQTFPKQKVTTAGASFLNYEDWARQIRSFEDLGAIRLHDYTLTGRGEPELVVAGTGTSPMFRLLRARPLTGRSFVASDDAPGAAAVAILSEGLWRDRFGGDPAVVGQTVSLDQRPYTIVGVMPASFKTP